MGVAPPPCFFACLAAFFSFGVSNGCFFVSLFDYWTLAMVFLLQVLKGYAFQV